MATISINNLGPIKKLDFDIKDFNLLIGEQASGKSTICKAIYFFRLIRDNILDYLYGVAINGDFDDKFPRVMNGRNKQIFIDIFGPSWSLSRNLKMIYKYNEDFSTTVSLSDEGYVSINYQKNEKGYKDIQKIESDMKVYYRKRSNQINKKNINETLNKNFISMEDIRLYNELNLKIGVIFGDSMPTYYIPAGRSLLSLMGNLLQPSYSISGTTTNINDELRYNTLDFINKRFVDIVRSNRMKFGSGVSQLYKHYEKKDNFYTETLPNSIIGDFKGEYFFEHNTEYIMVEDGKRISINFASSGQQEALWLFNLLYIWLLQGEKSFIIIEEPEVHLYPTLQNSIMEFIVKFANITKSTILITTHSPYILTSANLLLYGGKMMEKNESKVIKILGKNTYIIPQKSNILKIIQKENETSFDNLKDEDYNESLEIEKLDDIADTISEKYIQLMHIESEED